MSDLQRAWAKAKLGISHDAFDEAEEEEGPEGHGVDNAADDDSSSASSASSVSSTGTIVPTANQRLFARPNGVARGRTLEPIPWTTYFERELFMESEDQSVTFHAFLTSPVDKGPLFVMHHGAGSSGLTFAVVGSEIRKRMPNAGILAVDCRGHGSTVSQNEDDVDLSLSTLSSDLLFMICAVRARMGWAALPPLVLVGHSLGGAVVTNLASTRRLGASLLAYAVLDVVEGSAIDALQSMQTYLSTRPAGFASVEAGVDWHVRTRTVRGSTSARASVPALLRRRNDEDVPAGGLARPWRWRTDLAATQPFWEGWFAGLSAKFLAAPGGKLLLLAGTDRLDTALTIGQMQGKYNLQVFPEAGHFIHEDLPEQTAVSLVDFYKRNDRSQLVLPPKVSDLLKQGKKV
ncbi:Protein phosphatase methylesterase, eukaryotic [Cordyceps fumosorosea ARSEF 2679]|uniref:Protein phosphatase methylesterase 1 n=1 Tax=Cordyceps fumosorosea (strain ARSEF 2679) TaxID=1081104 RepID=A0A162LLJ1_CORFA|nr:Protein phosphatase methylesterase, eukaryotic [Cordyceps fumosorosea ARSEF 2679]OAA72394.1 Protein phosphatase methylesterase, eukaryotic [Cordyceps fumosorosea ARSEF 2679]